MLPSLPPPTTTTGAAGAAPAEELSEIAQQHARRKEALQREADAHERAALTSAVPRLASLLADRANEGAHAVHERQTQLAAEAAALARELGRLGAQLPGWAAASLGLQEALKHAGDVAHFARRVATETRALEEVLREDAEEEEEEERRRRRRQGQREPPAPP